MEEAIWSLRLRLHSGLRQSGNHPSASARTDGAPGGSTEQAEQKGNDLYESSIATGWFDYHPVNG
jgi:hypothetical protein